MQTFDPNRMRITGNALIIIGTSVGNYRGYFENLRVALKAKKLLTPNCHVSHSNASLECLYGSLLY